MLSDPYPVQPWTEPCRGSVRIPGSKSLTNRALIIAALGDNKVRLNGALFSRDTRIMATILQQLGFDLRLNHEEEWIEITGLAGEIPNGSGTFHVGNAGTAARFLTAFVCLHPSGHYHFDGDEEMRARPMQGLIDALRCQGARFTFHGEENCFPFEVVTSGLEGGRWEVDARASSQMLSALMMVAPLAKQPVTIRCPNVRPAFVDMTAGIMRQWDAIIAGSPSEGFELRGSQCYSGPRNGIFDIEPDVTAASYFMMLPRVVGGSLKILGFRKNLLQGDSAFASILRDIGLEIEQLSDGWRVTAGPLPHDRHRVYDFKYFSDTFLTLAAVAPLLPFKVTIAGIGHTRMQETDRIHAMANELSRVGAAVEEHETSLVIEPFSESSRPWQVPVTVETYKDHRVAMSFAILGCSPRYGGNSPWLRVADPACCGKTFPEFFDKLDELYRISHDK
ncbi:MAG: 3-phosphoshikimate 1-carboxyvinyltransferase [Puniceicoccaceae bacterium]